MSNDPYGGENNILPLDTNQSFAAPQKLNLNNEQIQALLQQLSSDEQQELASKMRSCTSEVTMTRGLPITGAILGSLYLSRQRLPAQYHFGPKGWPFYAIMGIASLTATNFMFMGMCRDQIQPKIEQLWRKYQGSKPTKTYEEIRKSHREAGGQNRVPPNVPNAEKQSIENDLYGNNPKSSPSQPQYQQGTFLYGSPSDSSSSSQYNPRGNEGYTYTREPMTSAFADDSASFMSGTPTSASGTGIGTNQNSGYNYNYDKNRYN